MPKLIGSWGNACTLSAEIMLKAEYSTISKKVGNWETVRYEFLIRLSQTVWEKLSHSQGPEVPWPCP